MSTFQLTHWVALADRFDQLRFRRALTAMSVGPVDRQWLADACGLSRHETRALLQALHLADALIVLPTTIARTSSPPTRGGRLPWAALHRRLRRWWNEPGLSRPPIGFDDLG